MGKRSNFIRRKNRTPKWGVLFLEVMRWIMMQKERMRYRMKYS